MRRYYVGADTVRGCALIPPQQSVTFCPMLTRALALLILALALSYWATVHFGQEVLIALGLILAQAKIIAKKLATIELPAVLAWLKMQTSAFFRFELIKKWMMTTVLPLVIGKAALRRIATWAGQYREAIRARYDAMMAWYDRLGTAEKVIAALAILAATVALSVTSIGLWLILFSVKLPLWIAAAATALGRMVWTTVSKMAFKAVAFFQLSVVWRVLRRVVPGSWLERKRRFDYRVARSVIRRRRMTLAQLEARKDSLPFRMGLLVGYLTGR